MRATRLFTTDKLAVDRATIAALHVHFASCDLFHRGQHGFFDTQAIVPPDPTIADDFKVIPFPPKGEIAAVQPDAAAVETPLRQGPAARREAHSGLRRRGVGAKRRKSV